MQGGFYFVVGEKKICVLPHKAILKEKKTGMSSKIFGDAYNIREVLDIKSAASYNASHVSHSKTANR